MIQENNRLSQWQTQFKDNHEGLLDEMFLTALSRFLQKREREELLAMFSAAPREAFRMLLEDILSSMLSSRKFLFTH